MDIGFNPFLAFGWCLFAGFIMSMGAGGGGILAGIGHISVLGIADANMIKVVNQMLEFMSRIVTVPLYHRQKRMVWSLAIAYGVGAPVGAAVGSWLSKSYLSDISDYRQVFGLLVAMVAARVLYEGWKGAAVSAAMSKAKAVSDRVQQALRTAGATVPGAHATSVTLTRVKVAFAGEEFAFNPLTAAAGGFAIGMVGAALGVGGGFLVTPFMASLLLFPMYLVVGTSLVALVVPLAISVMTYLLLEVNVNWWLVAVEAPAIMLGSMLGPKLNRHMNEKALKTFVAGVLLAIGVYYLAF
jgi:uncharacterized membrane protein YfcA